MTLELKESILKRAKDKSDEWGVAVSCRLESCADLVAEEAIYHMACYLIGPNLVGLKFSRS